MAGAITREDREFVEEWENISAPTYGILRFDVRGDIQQQVISGRRTFQITTAERKITQDRILRREDDPFQNGAFRPVIVPDSVTVDTNPNARSDDELRSILVSSDVAWDGWMEVLDSPETLTRMMDLAGEVDGVSLKRYKQVAARLMDVRPKTQIEVKDRDKFEALR